ncbi:MAG TPA: hypothetical protein VEF71_07940 [Streptosporangiaceae bacterium]|nr:hypothetical protein [Streptosporangiaceae bacterium]
MHIPGVTAHPAGARTAQQARSLLMDLGERANGSRFLIRDRDSKFTAASDGAFPGIGMRVINVPVRSLRANSSAERFAGTLGRQCLDQVLILGGGHLGRLPAGFARHDNGHRPRHGPRQEPPRQPGRTVEITARIERRQVLGGLISEYRTAAWRARKARPAAMRESWHGTRRTTAASEERRSYRKNRAVVSR